MKIRFGISVLLTLVNVHLLLAQPFSFAPKGVGGGGALFFPSINPANDNEFYVACDMGELFHSQDFGLTYQQFPFTRLRTGNTSRYEFTNNSNIAYCISNDGNTTFPVKTVDGGNNWTLLPGYDANLGELYAVKTRYDNPNIVVLGYYGDITISHDGGNTFSLVKHTANMGAGIILGGIFYDGTNVYIGTNEGLLKSTDNGINFTLLSSTGIPAGEVIWRFCAARSGSSLRFTVITASVNDTYNGLMPWDYWGYAKGVYVMDNASGAWNARVNGINFNNDFIMYCGMALNDPNTIYLGGNDNALSAPLVFKSTDGGLNWEKAFKTSNNQNIITAWSGVGGDKNWSWGECCFGITVAPNNSNKVMFGDFGFVHVSDNGGTSWRQAYANQSDQHPAASPTPAHQSYHSIGLENTSCWQVSWQDANTMMSAYSDIGAIRSSDAGNSWGFSYNGMSVNSVYHIATSNSGTLFAACSNIHDLYQSTRLKDAQLDAADANGKIMFSQDNGSNWSLLHNFGHPVFWIATDPGNANRMYAAVVHYGGGGAGMQGGIWMTDNLNALGGSSWIKLPPPPRTEGHPASILVLNDGKMVCTFSARINTAGSFTSSAGVFVYEPSTSTWSDVSDPGQLFWCKDLVTDPADVSQNTWYVGVFSGWGGAPNGKGGLYKTTNRGLSWNKLSGTLFDRVTSITFNPLDPHQAYLTTEGQGLWYSTDMQNVLPTWSLVESYPFQQAERVFFNPYDPNEVWVSSFGNGMKTGNLANTAIVSVPVNESDFLVTPNPVNNVIFIRCPERYAGQAVEIYSASGQLVYQSLQHGMSFMISCEGWLPGVYLIRTGPYARKLVKTY
ncbi:MAG: T9SS type A sorting domain-containing protein [Bacteroidota bacterium]